MSEEETGWECAICFAPIRYRKMKESMSNGGAFPVLMVEKSCKCEEDKFMNRTRGRFLSPERW